MTRPHRHQPQPPSARPHGPAGAGAADPLDFSRPAPARRYNYWLGGKDHFAPDRASGDAIRRRFPSIVAAARENRSFLQRAVRFLAAEAGIRQFLDIGTGIPLAPNVHDLAQGVDPRARVVYLDHDPVVMSHARALMLGHPDGRVGYLHADLRDPAGILTDQTLHTILELGQPVGLLLVAVLHFLDDHDDPYRHVTRLVEALPPGSHLALSHATFDLLPADQATDLADLATATAAHGTFRPRSRAEIARFLDGLDPLEPGLVPIVDWRADLEPAERAFASAQQTAMYGAVARKP